MEPTIEQAVEDLQKKAATVYSQLFDALQASVTAKDNESITVLSQAIQRLGSIK